MRDVLLLKLDPFFQTNFARFGMDDRMRPHRLGNRNQKLIRHPAQAPDNFQSFACALVEVAQRIGPPGSVKFNRSDTRLCDEVTAEDVGAGLAVGQVQNDFVNAPPLRGRLMQPHLPGEFA